MSLSTKTLLQNITRIKTDNHFLKYIDFIQFPFYRNLEINTRITLEFPLTVFIGQNGCGKSSALHALYGSVLNKTPSEFWFDTKLDPINYYDDARRRHSFWYSFKDSGVDKQVIKARIKRLNDPNYWETSRALVWAGMKREGTSRNTPIDKNVLYLDFRGELSAFDKFFYFGNTKGTKSKNKQEFIRKKSFSLDHVFSGRKSTINSSKRPLNDALHVFTKDELDQISFILGRKYVSGKSVKHSIFRNEGYSALFVTEYAQYSEAFAGSGEMAVVRLVQEVLKAPDYSLILLDEPEVSLHPGAQERLKHFLLEQIQRKKHQIVITSHSPSFIKGLPIESIKVFYQNPQNGRFLVIEDMLPEEAFFHIEFNEESKKNITVEDKLAKDIIDALLTSLGAATQSLFSVKYNPGGESVIKREFINVFSRDDVSKEFVIFDGDQNPTKGHLDWRSLPVNSVTNVILLKEIKEQTGEEIKFSVDGGMSGGNSDQRLDLMKRYLDYYMSNVFYLPGNIPEDIIWDDGIAEKLIGIYKSTAEIKTKMTEINILNSTKLKFAKLTDIVFDDSSSVNIAITHKIFIKAWIEQSNQDFIELKETINKIKNS